MGLSERLLVYRISIAGQGEASTALQSFASNQRRIAQEEIAVARQVAKAKLSATEQVLRATEKAEEKYARESARLAQQKAKSAAAAEKASVKATEASAKAKVKVAQQAEKDRERSALLAGANIVKALDKEVKAFAEAEKKKRKEDAETQKFLEKSAMATSRFVLSERRKQLAEQKRMDRDAMFDRKRLFRGLATGVAEGGADAFRMAGRMVGGGIRSIKSGLGLDEAFDVSGIVRERMAVSNKLRAISVEQRAAGGDFGDVNRFEAGMKDKLAAVSAKTGFGQEELVSALDVFSEKGKIKQGVDSIERVGVEARALGVDPAVVAKLRSQMLVSSDATGQNLQEEDLQKAVAQLAFIGKTGVFRAGAMAEQSEQMFSRYAQSGGDFRTGIAKYAAFANEARKATGSGAQAKTALNSLQDQFLKPKQQQKIDALLESKGMKTIFDENGEERDFVDLTMDVIQASGGGKNLGKYFDTRSMKAMSTLTTAFDSAGGGDKGRLAMEGVLSKGMGAVSEMTPEELTKDFGEVMTGEGMKFKSAIQSIRQQISKVIEPALEKLADKLPQIIEHITSVIDFIGKHPYLSGAAALAGGAAIGGGGTMARMGAASGMRWIGDRLATLGGGGGALGAIGGVASGLGTVVSQAGATPVFVTNWPAGGLGGGVGGAAPPGSAANWVIGPAAALALGYSIGSVLAPILMGKGTLLGDQIDKAAEGGEGGAVDRTKKGTNFDPTNFADTLTHGKSDKNLGKGGFFKTAHDARDAEGSSKTSWIKGFADLFKDEDDEVATNSFGKPKKAPLELAKSKVAGDTGPASTADAAATALEALKTKIALTTEALDGFHSMVTELSSPGGSVSRFVNGSGGPKK